METWQKGLLAVMKAEQRALEKNVILSRPFRDDARYDVIVDWCSKLYRVQIKYAGPTVSGVAMVYLTKGPRGERRYTSDEIDALIVYVADTDQICWFGPEIFHGKTKLHIRYAPCKNGQSKGCLLLENYVW